MTQQSGPTWLGPLRRWPAVRQALGADRLGLGAASRSAVTAELAPRTATADRVVKSICPYCAVGCGQNVYVKDEKVVQIEGDPDSPISRGRLCPKGSATLQLTTGEHRDAPGALPPARTAPTGSSSTSTRRWTWSPTGSSRTRADDLAVGARRASAPGARWASPASAAPRWTTRRTT